MNTDGKLLKSLTLIVSVCIPLFSGCSKKVEVHSNYEAPPARAELYTSSDAESHRGKPQKQFHEKSRPTAQIRQYANKTQVQIENGKEVALSRLPVGPENALSYWRYRFPIEKQKIAPTSSKNSNHSKQVNHSQPIQQLIIAEAGYTVLYQKGTGKVLQIIEYAEKK